MRSQKIEHASIKCKNKTNLKGNRKQSYAKKMKMMEVVQKKLLILQLTQQYKINRNKQKNIPSHQR